MHYEILLRGDTDGSLKGAHVLETPTSQARPIQAGDWPAIVAGINEAALVKASAHDVAVAARDTATADLAQNQAISDELATRAEAAMASGDLAALPAIIADAKLFGNAREKAKLQAEAAAKITEAAALSAQAEAL